MFSFWLAGLFSSWLPECPPGVWDTLLSGIFSAFTTLLVLFSIIPSVVLSSGAFTSIRLSLITLLPLPASSVLKPLNLLKSSGSVTFSGIPVSIYSVVSFIGNSGSCIVFCTILRFLPNFLFNSSRNTGIFSIFLLRLSSSVSCLPVSCLSVSCPSASCSGLSMPVKGTTASSGFFIAGFSFWEVFLLPATISSIVLVLLLIACLRLFSSISSSAMFISIRFTDCIAWLLLLACCLFMDGCGIILYEGAL